MADRIHPTESGRWQVRWTRLDGSEGKRTVDYFATAVELDRLIQHQRGLGIDWYPTPTARGGPSLVEVMNAYVDHNERVRAENTTKHREGQLDLFIRWLIAREETTNVWPDSLSRATLEAYDRHLATKGHRKPLEPSSRKEVIGVVHRFWRWAWDREEWHGFIPAPRSVELATVIPASVHAPTWAQMDGCIAACRQEWARLAATLLRCLGWRVSQICRLAIDDVDFSTGTINFDGRLGKTAYEKGGRLVTSPFALGPELRALRRRPGEALVPKSPQAVRRALRRAWARSGAPPILWARRPDHAFRKGFATELGRVAGVKESAIEYWCGRKTKRTPSFSSQVTGGSAPISTNAPWFA